MRTKLYIAVLLVALLFFALLGVVLNATKRA